MRQTAVDFLEDCFDKYEKWISGHYKAQAYSFTDLSNDIQKAKQIEKDLITEAYSQGRIDEETRFPYATDGEDYFNLEFTQSSE